MRHASRGLDILAALLPEDRRVEAFEACNFETRSNGGAVAPRQRAEAARRHPGGAPEAAHEIRQIAETDIIGDVGDGALLVGEQAGRVAQARAPGIDAD